MASQREFVATVVLNDQESAVNPSSPVNFVRTVFSGVASAKSSLHFCFVYFWEPELEAIEEYLLVVRGLGKTPFANVNAAAGWQNHVQHV